MNMNFYIDFEATQPEQEIISIGVYSDSEESFYALVKPQFSKISKYITDMTGITNEMVEDRYDLDTAFNDLYIWCANQESNLNEWHFYSYGDGDVDFIKHSMCNIKTQRPLIIASIMIATMKDYSKEVKKYFCGSTSLIKAYNYLKDLENQQKHNALEDAKMLADVFMKTFNKEPLATNPFIEQAINSYKFPSGKFFCKGIGKNSKEREFGCIQEAIEWIINTNIRTEDRDAVRRDKMAVKIMKAIKKKERYMNYNWRRER
jgi:DNA polymerase III epsilon subunit-like protein